MLKRLLAVGFLALSPLALAFANCEPIDLGKDSKGTPIQISTCRINPYVDPGPDFKCPTEPPHQAPNDPSRWIFPEGVMKTLGELTPLDGLWPGDGVNSEKAIWERLNIAKDKVVVPYPLNSWIANLVWNRSVKSKPNEEQPYHRFVHLFGACEVSGAPVDGVQKYTRAIFEWGAEAFFYPYPMRISSNVSQLIEGNLVNPMDRGLKLANIKEPQAAPDQINSPYETYKIEYPADYSLVLSLAGENKPAEHLSDVLFNLAELPVETPISKIGHWSVDLDLPYPSDPEKKLRITSTQGSPFLFIRAIKGANIALRFNEVAPEGTHPSLKWIGENKPILTQDKQIGEVDIAGNPIPTKILSGKFKAADGYDYGYEVIGVMQTERTYEKPSSLKPKENSYYSYYVIFAPKDTNWFSSLVNLNAGNTIYPKTTVLRYALDPSGDKEGERYISIAALPGRLKDKTDEEIKEIVERDYLPYAFNFIKDTKVSYQVIRDAEELKIKVKTTYNATIDNVLGSGSDKTLLGIFPHQYKEGRTYLSVPYDTVRGTLHHIVANEFTVEMTYPGILPWLPGLPITDPEGLMKQMEYAKMFQDNRLVGINPDGSGTDTYAQGKRLNRVSQAVNILSQLWSKDQADYLLERQKSSIARYFTDPKTQCQLSSDEKQITYFYKNKELDTIIGYWDFCNPEENNPVFAHDAYMLGRELNDHPFHYGYFISAAGQIALRDKTWGETYKKAINALVKDIANLEKSPEQPGLDQTHFPFRNFDPYMGYTRTSGANSSPYGPNMESSSEAMNAYAGLILWGEATGQQDIADAGIYIYTTMANSIWHYWFDRDFDGSSYFNAQYKKAYSGEAQHSYSSIIHDGANLGTTFWTASPRDSRLINVLPLTGASFYLGFYPDQVKTHFDGLAPSYERYYRAFWGIAPDATQVGAYHWNDIAYMYNMLGENYGTDHGEAIINAWFASNQKAIEKGREPKPNGGGLSGSDQDVLYGASAVQDGNSLINAYTWMRTLMNYGQPDFETTTNAPFYSVFKGGKARKSKNGKVYVVYNPGKDFLLGVFSDGQAYAVGPHSMWISPYDEPGIRGSIHWESDIKVVQKPDASVDFEWTKDASSSAEASELVYKAPSIIVKTPEGGYGFKGDIICDGIICKQNIQSFQPGEYEVLIEVIDKTFNATPATIGKLFTVLGLSFPSENLNPVVYYKDSKQAVVTWKPAELKGSEDKARILYNIELFKCLFDECADNPVSGQPSLESIFRHENTSCNEYYEGECGFTQDDVVIQDGWYQLNIEAKDNEGQIASQTPSLKHQIKGEELEKLTWDSNSVIHNEKVDSIELSWDSAVGRGADQVTYDITTDEKTDHTKNTYYTIADLEPDHTYEVSVLAKDHNGKQIGKFGPVSLKTEKASTDDFDWNHQVLTIDEVGSDYAKVSWNKPKVKEGEVFYTLFVNDKEVASNIDQLSHRIDNLEPDTLYKIEIMATNKGIAYKDNLLKGAVKTNQGEIEWPNNGDLSPVVVNNTAHITWSVAKAGGHPIENYHIKILANNGDGFENDLTGTTFTVDDLKSDVHYDVAVTAKAVHYKDKTVKSYFAPVFDLLPPVIDLKRIGTSKNSAFLSFIQLARGGSGKYRYTFYTQVDGQSPSAQAITVKGEKEAIQVKVPRSSTTAWVLVEDIGVEGDAIPSLKSNLIRIDGR